MWQRFTERARRVVFFAQEEAVNRGASMLLTEHLLLGLIRENDSVASRLLDEMGVTCESVFSAVDQQAERISRDTSDADQPLQLAPEVKRVIDLAYEHSRQLNNNYIGTEHLLLGLIAEEQGLAARVLGQLGIDLDRTRRRTIKLQERGSGYSLASKRVAGALRDLPSELRQALEGEGRAFSSLPTALQEALRGFFLVGGNPNFVVEVENAVIRVVSTETPEGTNYKVLAQTEVSLEFTDEEEEITTGHGRG